MSGGALGFMLGAWAIILGACIVTLASLVKHSK
jgi:uncharacterized membrane protein YczE